MAVMRDKMDGLSASGGGGVWTVRTAGMAAGANAVGAARAARDAWAAGAGGVGAAGAAPRHGALLRPLLRIAACLLVLAATCLLAMPARAEAGLYQPLDPSQDGSLTVNLVDGKTGIPGAEFSLYRVADVSADAHYTLSGDFASYAVSLTGLDAEGWRATTQALAGYAARDGIASRATAVTNASGAASFGTVPAGLYLVVASPVEFGSKVYTVESALVGVPGLNDDGTWSHAVSVNAKFSTEPAPTDLTVRKVWADSDNKANKRPQSVTVQLLGNGKVVDEVVLSSKNGWQHEFRNLDGSVSWQIVEKSVPGGYTVGVDREGTVVTVTNTYEPPVPGTEEPPGGKLPQTGLLWWPVLPLVVCGGGLMLFGWYRWRSHRDDA